MRRTGDLMARGLRRFQFWKYGLLPPIAPYSAGVAPVHEFHWMSVAEIEKNPAQEPDLSNPSLFCKS